jgi:hypothetical protein
VDAFWRSRNCQVDSLQEKPWLSRICILEFASVTAFWNFCIKMPNCPCLVSLPSLLCLDIPILQFLLSNDHRSDHINFIQTQGSCQVHGIFNKLLITISGSETKFEFFCFVAAFSLKFQPPTAYRTWRFGFLAFNICTSYLMLVASGGCVWYNQALHRTKRKWCGYKELCSFGRVGNYV